MPDRTDDDLPDEGSTSFSSLYRDQIRRTQASMVRWTGEVRPRRQDLRSDFLAGVPGAISSVPDGMASSLLAGVPPVHGLYASFAGPIAGGLTSSTRLMLVTTTSAAALAAGSALESVAPDERSEAVLWLTLMAGGFMLAAAAVGASRYIRFVSHSVMLGFLTGVAVNMILGQLPDLLGVDAKGAFALSKAVYLLRHPQLVDWPTAATGIGALGVLVVLSHSRLAVFSSLVALVVPTAVVLLAESGSVAQVKDSGALPTGLPMPTLPGLTAWSPALLWGALSIAVIVLVQGAGVAEAVPNPDGSPASTKRDFAAQGFGNLASGVFGGQPVGGSVGQTALNLTAGARSRWAAIWSGLWMLAILLAFSGLVGQVMMATLAAVLVYAGWGTIRPFEILTVARAGTIPLVALTGTFAAVLVLPVAEAVGVGVAASLLMQLNQEALDLRVVRLEPDESGRFREARAPAEVDAGDIVVLDVYGSLFYAGARTLQHHLPHPHGPGPGSDLHGPLVIVRLRGRSTLGATFLKVIGDYAHRLEGAGGELYLSGVDPALVARWETDGVTRAQGNIRLFPATPILGEATLAALAEARPHRVTAAETGPEPFTRE